jgi:hypothetical protein
VNTSKINGFSGVPKNSIETKLFENEGMVFGSEERIGES